MPGPIITKIQHGTSNFEVPKGQRRKTDEERRYFEVTPAQRWTMAAMYFGLIALLVLGMQISHIPREALENR